MTPEQSVNSVFALAAAIREQANSFIAGSLAARGITDLLPAHGAVLNALFQQSPLQMSTLAEAIGRKKNTVTSLINTLEERGYCRREPDPQDARAQLIALTAKGEAMRDIQAGISGELLRKAWSGLSEKETKACVRTLLRVLSNLKQE